VIALHGAGRYVFPYTTDGYMRPMPVQLFAQYIQHALPMLDANQTPAVMNVPIKLSICFGAQPFGASSSVGSELAQALGRPTLAGRGLVFPAESADPYNWVRFG